MSDAPEFSRVYDLRQLPRQPVTLTADADERTALAGRLGLVRLDALEARFALVAGEAGRISAEGGLNASVVQSCAVSGEDVPATIAVPLALLFVPASDHHAESDEATELDSDAPDEIDYSGGKFDLGEAIAQSLALALDPFPRAADADALRKVAGILTEDEAKAASGPFAALSQLKR